MEKQLYGKRKPLLREIRLAKLSSLFHFIFLSRLIILGRNFILLTRFYNEIFRVLKIGCSTFDFNCPRIVRVELGIYSCVQPDDALSGHERPRDFIRVPIAIMDPQIRNVHVYALSSSPTRNTAANNASLPPRFLETATIRSSTASVHTTLTFRSKV